MLSHLQGARDNQYFYQYLYFTERIILLLIIQSVHQFISIVLSIWISGYYEKKLSCNYYSIKCKNTSWLFPPQINWIVELTSERKTYDKIELSSKTGIPLVRIVKFSFFYLKESFFNCSISDSCWFVGNVPLFIRFSSYLLLWRYAFTFAQVLLLKH